MLVVNVSFLVSFTVMVMQVLFQGSVSFRVKVRVRFSIKC